MKHYDECYFLNYDSYQDLNLYEIGCQSCPPNYSFGPIIRENYVLHYIIQGKGTLNFNGSNFPVCQNQAFITSPNLPAFYRADEKDPWNYIWIHVNGDKIAELLHAAGITNDHPVFIPVDSNTDLRDALLHLKAHKDHELASIGQLYLIFDLLIHNSSTKPKAKSEDSNLRYIRETINYISRKYNEQIKISHIADTCGLDRSYLCKIFKQATNYSPQEYLIYYRMKKAKQLLRDPNEPIQHIAYSVGYPDPFAFSKIFKKETGMSPSQYRAHNMHVIVNEDSD